MFKNLSLMVTVFLMSSPSWAGKLIVVHPDGTRTETHRPNYLPDHIETQYPDGRKVEQFGEDHIRTSYPDGSTKEENIPNQKTTYKFDGYTVTLLKDTQTFEQIEHKTGERIVTSLNDNPRRLFAVNGEKIYRGFNQRGEFWRLREMAQRQTLEQKLAAFQEAIQKKPEILKKKAFQAAMIAWLGQALTREQIAHLFFYSEPANARPEGEQTALQAAVSRLANKAPQMIVQKVLETRPAISEASSAK